MLTGEVPGRGSTLVGDLEGSFVGLLCGLLLGLPRLGTEAGTLAGGRGAWGHRAPASRFLASSTLVRQLLGETGSKSTRAPMEYEQ